MADRKEDQALIEQATAAFACTPEDTEALARSLYEARVKLATVLHTHAQRARGKAPTLHWHLPTDLLHTLAEDAWKTARGIVDTYQTDLRWQAEGFVEAWAASSGTLDGCKPALAKQLGRWAAQRAEWKSAQISKVETANALKHALDASLHQTQRADFNDAPMVLVIMPFDAAEPFCQALVATIWPIDAWVWLFGALPAHGGCPHFAFPVSPAEVGLDVFDEDEDEEDNQ